MAKRGLGRRKPNPKFYFRQMHTLSSILDMVEINIRKQLALQAAISPNLIK